MLAIMSDTDEVAEKPTDKQQSFWGGFSQSDMRLLVITIVGTLVGGILLAIVIALAVIVARSGAVLPRHGSSRFQTLNGIAILVGSAVVYVVGFIGASKRARLMKGWGRRSWPFYVAVAAVFAVAALVFPLAVLGVAVGVK
jgi:hypothetical protein